MTDIRVLVVEDDPLAALAHAEYLAAVPGFRLAGLAHTAAEAMDALERTGVDLVLLDMHLPDGHGIDLVRRIRAAGLRPDIVAVTAAREAPVVRAAIALGVVQYLIKPFAQATFTERLERYRELRLAGTPAAPATGTINQADVDRALDSLRGSVPERVLPKGVAPDTLAAVEDLLREAGRAFSAAEVTAALGISRITARRYLEFLTAERRVRREPRYGAPGRPELEYRWSGGASDEGRRGVPARISPA